MTCAQIQRSLSAYVDRQLPAWEKTEVGEHAETCPDCQAEIASILDLKRALRAQAIPGMPGDLRRAIQEATVLKHAKTHAWLDVRWWAPALTFAAAGVAAWFLMHRTPGDPASVLIKTIIARQSAQPPVRPANITAWHRDPESSALQQTQQN